MVVTNRKEVESLIYRTFNAMDPSGANTEKYKEMFGAMNDQQFAKFMKEFLDNPMDNFSFDMVDFERDLRMENVEKAAKVLGIELFEYVYLPHLTMDKTRVVRTKQKVLVGYFNIKRPQQLLHKKNGLSLSNERRSMLTGQVTGKDKNSRDSDIEASMLVALGCNSILQELHGPRADDMTMKAQMNQSIRNKGYAMLEDMDNLPTNKTTLVTIDTYLLGMMLKSDLITDTYILPKTSAAMFENVSEEPQLPFEDIELYEMAAFV